MKTETKPQPNESRYMTSDKKHYYLASVDENVQTLIKEQIDELTRVLIDLKSQYDTITRDTTNKKKETEELCKKIVMLEKMDEKSKKKIEGVNQASEQMQAAIEIKKQKLSETQYEKKTLLNKIEKMKTDILLTKKEIIIKENDTKRLNKNYQKEKLKENNLKQQQNQIYSKIMNQTARNRFDEDEQNLQLQYYNQIIDQKNMFIKSADERKERQLKIAQEAKNDSQDKQEVELRKQLGILRLYNKYLRNKMDIELASNEKLEETYQKIRDTVGTSNLKTIVEKMIYKDKRYNDCVARVAEYESGIEILDKDINELESKVIELKNEVLVKETDNDKTLSTIPTSIIEENENELIKQEIELKRTLGILQEKHKNISLVHEKIIENMRHLSANINIENLLSTQPPIKSDANEGENSELMTSTVNNNNASRVVVTETMNDVDSDLLKPKFFEFLHETMKKFEMLFLCHSKQEFLNLMREKGIEAVNEAPQIVNRRQGTQRRNKEAKPIKTDTNVYGDEMEIENDNLETDDRHIFDTFTRTQKAKINDFISKNTEKKK